MNNTKKIYIIGLSIFFSIVLLVVLICIKKENPSKENLNAFDLLVDESIFSEHVDIILDVSEKKDNNNWNPFDKDDDEETSKQSEIVLRQEYTYSDGKINIDNGDLNVISSSYISLNDNYDLMEFLIGNEGINEYLNDNQLSTSFDFASKYDKRWIIIDKKTKEHYVLLEDSYHSLTLNPYIKEGLLEVDVMYNNNSTDHYSIPINDIFWRLKQEAPINLRTYSVFYEEKELSPKDFVKNTKTNIDLDGDGTKENIEAFFYNGDTQGVILNINDKSIRLNIDFPCTNIAILDLDNNDKYKELLISSSNPYSEEIVQTYIVSYVNGEIIETLHSHYAFEELDIRDELNRDFYEKDLKMTNGVISFRFLEQDSIQNWILNAKYKFDENHRFILENSKYYECVEGTHVITHNHVPIVVYSDKRYVDIEKITIPKNSEVIFIGTSLDFWGVVKYNDNIYYLPVSSNGMIIDLNTSVGSVFEGLCISD